MQHSDSASSLLRSLLSLDPADSEVQDFWCRTDRGKAGLNTLKERISTLCIPESALDSSRLAFMDTKSSTKRVFHSRTSSQVNFSTQQSLKVEKLKVQRDKHMSLNAYYRSLQKQLKENSRIAMNELHSRRNHAVSRINSLYENKVQNIREFEAEISLKIDNCIAKGKKYIQGIGDLISKVERNFRYESEFLDSVMKEEMPEPEVNFEHVKVNCPSFECNNKAVQVDIVQHLPAPPKRGHRRTLSKDSTNAIRIKVYLPGSSLKFCPVHIQSYSTAQHLLECLRNSKELGMSAYLALKSAPTAPEVPIHPHQIISELNLTFKEWPKLYLLDN